MFVDEVSVYRNSINEMKEMEKGDEELGVSLRKRLSFYTKEWIHSLSILRVSRVWSILSRSLLPRLTALCVCVCVGRKMVVCEVCRVHRFCNSQPIRPLRLRDGHEVHVYILSQTPTTWTSRVAYVAS